MLKHVSEQGLNALTVLYIREKNLHHPPKVHTIVTRYNKRRVGSFHFFLNTHSKDFLLLPIASTLHFISVWGRRTHAKMDRQAGWVHQWQGK